MLLGDCPSGTVFGRDGQLWKYRYFSIRISNRYRAQWPKLGTSHILTPVLFCFAGNLAKSEWLDCSHVFHRAAFGCSMRDFSQFLYVYRFFIIFKMFIHSFISSFVNKSVAVPVALYWRDSKLPLFSVCRLDLSEVRGCRQLTTFCLIWCC